MKHVFEQHTNCRREHCSVCDGGLAICVICGCIEGSLATECPGFDCYATHGADIYNGKIDFIDGRWQAPTPRSVAGHW